MCSFPILHCPRSSHRSTDHSRGTPHHKAPTLPSPEPSDVLRHPLLPSTLQPLHPSEIPSRTLQQRHRVQLHSLQSAPNSTMAQHDQDGCPAGISQSISGRVCWFWERPRGSSLQLPASQPPGLSLKAAPTSSSSQSCLQKPVSSPLYWERVAWAPAAGGQAAQ